MATTDTNTSPDSTFLKMENSSGPILVTGKAGTGKSTLLRYFRENTSKNTIVLAPTGIAAINVQGVTIHSFFRFPLRPLVKANNEIMKFSRSSDIYKIISDLDTIIIDEISMVRADILDAMDYSLRMNGGKQARAFGGKQLIMFGDLFQLPPVLRKDEIDMDLYKQLYPSPYFFNAHTFKRNPPEVVELKTVYRQNDPEFISVLDKIRFKSTSYEDLQSINQRVTSEAHTDEWSVTLTTTNSHADRINHTKLRELSHKQFTFNGKIEGTWDSGSLPTLEKLTLKENSQVMFIRNDTTEHRWVNGTIGKIKSLSKTNVEVELMDGNVCKVEPVTWEKRKYKYDKEKEKITSEVLATFSQLPLRLAWAVTIHKSQGLTLDKVNIDLGRGAFAHGQLYVALSRCRSLEGITLTRPVRERDIIVDSEVVTFLKSGQV